MTHPLTDSFLQSYYKYGDGPYDEDQMRDVADWQLEQDAKYFAQYLINHFYFAPEVAELRAEWFKEAMRPQEGNS